MKTARSSAHGPPLCFLFALAGVMAAQSGVSAETDGSDALARHAIFAEQHVADSALVVHRGALLLDAEQRYERLAQWVLPGPDHDTLRLDFDFSPLDPAPPVDLDADTSAAGTRLHSGGQLVAPALDLIAVAARLGKLPSIRQAMEQPRLREQGVAAVDRQAMLLLIDLALDAPAVDAERLHQLLTAASPAASSQAAPSAAEMLLFHAAIEYPHLRTTLADAMHRYQPWITSTSTNRTAAQQHVCKLIGRTRAWQAEAVPGDDALQSTAPLQQWLPASRSTAASRGLGFPVARWDRIGGTVANRASHDDDYLYFAIPMRGPLEIECDVSDFSWRDSHLMVAGVWVAPVYTLSDYDIGHFRSGLPRIHFKPPLTKVKQFIRYRTVVRDSVATTSFNGRIVHQQPLSAEHDPWVAIRSAPQHDGEVRNVRISGTPQIPSQLSLSADPQLGGWLPYDEESRFRPMPLAWQHVGELESGGEIRSLGSPSQARLTHGPFAAEAVDEATWQAAVGARGTGSVERLLRYHRPMLEDGTIGYEFFYTPDQTLVHPAIDRLALLLSPSGVRVHWITDGRFDRTGLDPANVHDEPESRLHPGPLPLHENAWNRLEVQLVGDVITLVLNDQPIFARALEPTNQRTFGLFHFADQTSVRVRDIQWQGTWPRQLPPVQQQELFVDETGFLDDRLPQLTAHFSHDFATDGFSVNRFTVVAGDSGADIRPTTEGLRAGRSGSGGYRTASLSPLLSVGGDFDITATFDHLQTDPHGPDGSSSIWLAAGDREENDVKFLRRQVLVGGDRQIVDCVRVFRHDNELQRRYFSRLPVEARAGTLRLARRGDQIFYLFAENDSSAFRIIGQQAFHAEEIAEPAIELASQIFGATGNTSVIWKQLSVRAERLAGQAVGDHEQGLASLNQQRDALPAHFTHDFTRQAPDPQRFARWTDQRPWDAEDGGLRIAHIGADQWQSAGASLLRQLEGDFDVAIEFDLEQLDDPAEGQQSAIYLQLELADAAKTQLSAILAKRSGQAVRAVGQLRLPQGADEYHYQPLGSFGVTSATGLRIARRGERVYFMVTSENLAGEAVIARADASKDPVSIGGTRLMVHTGGAGRESRIRWRRIAVHAQRFSFDPMPTAATGPVPVQRPAQIPQRPRQKSALESLLDIFR